MNCSGVSWTERISPRGRCYDDIKTRPSTVWKIHCSLLASGEWLKPTLVCQKLVLHACRTHSLHIAARIFFDLWLRSQTSLCVRYRFIEKIGDQRAEGKTPGAQCSLEVHKHILSLSGHGGFINVELLAQKGLFQAVLHKTWKGMSDEIKPVSDKQQE